MGVASLPVPRDPRKLRHEAGKLQQRLRRLVGQAIGEFAMIGEGDRVMVCLSGGKDSFTLLDLLLSLRARAPVAFDLVAVHLDQKQPGYPAGVMAAYLDAVGIEYHIIEQDTYSVVQRVVPEGRTMCGLCSRLRRGALLPSPRRTASRASHSVTTATTSSRRSSSICSSVPSSRPCRRSCSATMVGVVIRPLAYCREADIARYAERRGFPIIPCNLCGSQEHLQRGKIKAMLAEWERLQPGRVENVFRSLQTVVPSHLADTGLFDFSGLGAPAAAPPPTARAWLVADAHDDA